ALDDENFLFVVGSFGNESSERIGNEGISPKLQTRVTVSGLALEANAVDDGDINAVGDGMSALNGAPGIELRCTEFRFFVRMPADAGGIEDDLRATERGNARAFRIPLVPTNLHADLSILGVEVRKAEIAGSEIKFFVIERIVGDVHFAVFAEEAAVGV